MGTEIIMFSIWKEEAFVVGVKRGCYLVGSR